MAKLAIKGHATRSKEVIEILEMLGGINHFNHEGNTFAWYVIEEGRVIRRCLWLSDEKRFTLEEFLEKYPYKVGDKVLLDGVVKTIKQVCWDSTENAVIYKLETNVRGFSEEYYVYHYDLQPYKEQEPMEEQKGTLIEINLTEEKLEDKVEIILDDNHEVKIEDSKVYIVKKQPQYPKTYEECCDILASSTEAYFDHGGDSPRSNDYEYELESKLLCLRKLLICRDAYWKLAEWNPKIKGEKFYMNSLPSFLRDLFPMPTEEMRCIFYENFKELIEQCKELL